jgi:outer membrane protein
MNPPESQSPLMMSGMKQSKKLILLFSFFLLIFLNGARAQKVWSLEDCIMYAFDNNISIKQQVLSTEYNENLLQQSKVSQAPNLNAGASYGYSFGRALDETTYEFKDNQTIMSNNVNLTSSVTLFNGLQQRNTIEQNKYNLLASMKDLDKLKNDISLFLASGYLQILFNRELLQVAINQHELTLQQVERTGKLVEAGSLARGSLLEIQAQAASEELNVINAQNQLDISYLNLTQMLDLDSVGDFKIEIPEFGDVASDPITVTVDMVYRDALNVLPQVQSAELQLKSAYEGLSIAQGMRSPELNINAQWRTGYSDARQKLDLDNLELVDMPYWEQMDGNQNTTVFLGLSIPIFNGWMIKTNISNARLNVLNTELELETTKMDLYKSIQQAFADATAARKKYLATEEALEAMEESFKYTEEKFEVGLVNTVDYNTEKNRLTTTQSDLLQAKYDYIFKMKVLDFYRGIPITL